MDNLEEREEINKSIKHLCDRSSADKTRDFDRGKTNIHSAIFRMGWAVINILRLPMRRKMEYQALLRGSDAATVAADILRAEGDYAGALPLYQEALETSRRVLGENHPGYATALNNLAIHHDLLGDYSGALPLYERALEINKRVLGKNHHDYLTTLNNLAGLHESMGDYAGALSLYQEVLETSIRVRGENHPDYLTTLNNLACLHHSMGDYAGALPIYQQVLEIRKNALGEDHPDYAISLNNLASYYHSVENYVEALPLCEEALERLKRVFGENHPDYARTLNNLALLYHSIGDYARALPANEQALKTRKRVFGEDHPDYAQSLNNLALLYMSTGYYARALPLFEQALGIIKDKLGENHLDYANVLSNIAGLYAATDLECESFDLMLNSSQIEHRTVWQIFSVSSGSQRMAFLESIRKGREKLLSLVTTSFMDAPCAVHRTFDIVLCSKALTLESQMMERDAWRSGRYPHLESKFQELRTLRMQIVRIVMDGPRSKELEAHNEMLAEWSAQKDSLESELARSVPEMSLEQKLRNADKAAICMSLPDESLLVEFVRYDIFDFKAVPSKDEKHWKPARYLAFVLPAGKPDNIGMVDLGEAKPIDDLISTFRQCISEEPGRGILSNDSSIQMDSNWIGNTLHKLVFEKLIPFFPDGCTRLFLCPDGELSKLPFEVLPDDYRGYLIDKYQISYLGCGRDALRFNAQHSGEQSAPIIVADPDFNLDADMSVNEDINVPVQSASFGVSCDLRDAKTEFDRLEGSRLEAENIASILGVKPWLGSNALDPRLRSCQSPRILHIATHGFFLADQEVDRGRDDWSGSRASDEVIRRRMGGGAIENPLLRSGLVFSGANTWLRSGNTHPEAEDGILTAEDAALMDLRATDLVVLSACDTGLGDIKIGEGVFGLRRSFILAGAKTLVMSLWKVPDKETQELMDDFYRNLLAGLTCGEALRSAQLKIRSNIEYANKPFYWGAFICQGDADSKTLLELDQKI